jgi:hypothetical protein
MKVKVTIASLVLALTGSITSPAVADWRLTSDNSPSGLTSYASTYWIDGIGPVNYAGLVNYQVPDNTLFSSLLLQCTKKKLVISFSLMQTGSAHDDLSLDDPGFMQVQVQNSGLNKKLRYKTLGLGLEGTLAINTKSQELATYFTKARTARMQFVLQSGKKVSPSFDVRDLSLAKTRFAYAGCKF